LYRFFNFVGGAGIFKAPDPLLREAHSIIDETGHIQRDGMASDNTYCFKCTSEIIAI
jgi:hypothetical protein